MWGSWRISSHSSQNLLSSHHTLWHVTVALLKLACSSLRAIRGQSEGGPIVLVQLAKLSTRDKVDEGCYILEALNFIFHLLTNTFLSHDLFPPPFHHMTLSPDCLPIALIMWFSLAVHVTHTDSNLVACILGLTRESVRLGMTPYFCMMTPY